MTGTALLCRFFVFYGYCKELIRGNLAP